MNQPTPAHLAVVPAIAGLRFRGLRDATDYAGMAAVRQGSREWDHVDPQSPREEIPTTEGVAATFPLTELREHPDLLIVTIDGQIVGYNHVLWRWTEVTGERVYLHLGYLLPAWRDQGIGSAMLHWSQRRIREIAAQDPHAGPVTCATNVSSTEREADALMRHEGYVAVRRLSDMVLEPIPSPVPSSLPVGVRRRPLVPEHFSEVYAAWKDAFAGVWTSTPSSQEDFEEFVGDNLAGPTFDPTLCEVAWSDDQVVGFVLGRIRNGVGVIAEVAVRPQWQRGGIARALMHRVLTSLEERGVPQARLFTDADDGQGARSLYERLGFRERKQHVFYRKPLHADQKR
jgi:ribosomal protein S18 acetylase RimI-like enzyme